MKKKKGASSSYFPIKNYIYTALIIMATIAIGLYVLSWYNVKKQEKLITSYLISSNTITSEINNVNEIVQVLKESPNEYFVYISYTNDENVYRLEKKLKKIIDEHELKDEFYYINITEEKDNKNIYAKLNNAFNTTKINNVPCILYFKNNTLKEIIVNKDNLFNPNDFIELLDQYEYEKISQ